MKVIKLTLMMMILSVIHVHAQKNETAILGSWESDEKDVRMEIFKEGAEYKGRLIWGNKIVEADGVTSKKDSKNPDKTLRSNNIIGMVSLTGLKWDGDEYTDGKIYDPPSGKSYSCKAWVSKGKMHLRGYMGFSMLGKTVDFHPYTGPK